LSKKPVGINAKLRANNVKAPINFFLERGDPIFSKLIGDSPL
jgi:hypothetical protein